MERAEIMSQILAILEDVAEIAPEDVNEDSVLMDDLDLSSMEILTIVADLEETFGLRIPEKELRNFVTRWIRPCCNKRWMPRWKLPPITGCGWCGRSAGPFWNRTRSPALSTRTA